MSVPTPAERFRRRLEGISDGARHLEAAVERATARGGGEVVVRLHVDAQGEITAMELVTRFERRAEPRA